MKEFFRIMIIAFVVGGAMVSSGIAQQPVAVISALHGDVLVSLQGQEDAIATQNTQLKEGDAIQTQAGATVTLSFSDGSSLELGEQTMIELEIFQQPANSEARLSEVYLLWGRVRAFLAQGHQGKGSSFKIDTLNATVSATFSQPDIEVFYNPQSDATTVLARTVAVLFTNLLTAETAFIVDGHTGIIQGQAIEEKETLEEPNQQPVVPPDEAPKTPGLRKIRQLIEAFENTRQVRAQIGRLHAATSGTQASSQTFASKPAASSGTTPQSGTHEVPMSPSKGTEPSPPDASRSPQGASTLSSSGAGTTIAIGAGALAAAGGTAAILVANSEDDMPTNGVRGGLYHAAHTIVQTGVCTIGGGSDAVIDRTIYVESDANGFSFEVEGTRHIEARYTTPESANVTVTLQTLCGTQTEHHSATTTASILDGVVTIHEYGITWCEPDCTFQESWVLTPD